MMSFLTALGFLTRIPVPASAFMRPDAQRNALPWYPLVGVVIGALLCAAHWLLQSTAPLLAAAIIVSLWVAITGGLHLDGLADSADAWVGGMGDREKTLRIMKDPASGPIGVTVIVLLLLLKFAAIASLPATAWPALLIAPILARSALVLAFLTTPYVRSGGMGSTLRDAPRGKCWLLLAAVLLPLIALGWASAIAMLVMLAVLAYWRSAVKRRLGGFTGDTAGALAELIEVAVLVTLAMAVPLL